MKTCNKCGFTLPKSEFYKDNRSIDCLFHSCKKCYKDNVTKYQRTEDGYISKMYNGMKDKAKVRNKKYNTTIYSLSISKEEFIEFLYNNLYESYYWNWMMSNFSKYTAPSIDRINDYKGYDLNNIKLTYWKKNKDRSHYDRKNGINNKNSKAVLQFDLNGNFLIEYWSLSEAARKNNFNISSISKCCYNDNGLKVNQYKGFIWKFK